MQRLAHGCKGRVKQRSNFQTVVTDEGNLATRKVSGVPDGTHRANGNNVRHAAHCCRRLVKGKKALHRGIAAFKAQFGCFGIARHLFQAGIFQAAFPSVGALTGKIIHGSAADMGDPAVTERRQIGCHLHEGELVIDIQPGRVAAVVRAAVRHKGNFEILQNTEPRVVAVGPRNDQAADMPRPGDFPEHRQLVLGTVRRQNHQVPATTRQRLGHACHQLAKEGFGQLAILHRHHITDRVGLSRGKASRMCIGLVTKLVRHIAHTRLGPGGNVPVIVQGPRHRALRQV